MLLRVRVREETHPSHEEFWEPEVCEPEHAKELWETTNVEEPWEPCDTEEVWRVDASEEPLNLDTLREALPWAEYQGISAEQFGGAMQRMEGNPLFEFQFSPISEQQWLRTVQKTIYNAKLRQRRELEDSDDMGVALVSALEEAIKNHLQKIEAREDDKIFLAMTPQGFEHAYQTVTFPVHEFTAGSTRLDALLHKLAGKLNSNQSFHPNQGISHFPIFPFFTHQVYPINPGSSVNHATGSLKQL